MVRDFITATLSLYNTDKILTPQQPKVKKVKPKQKVTRPEDLNPPTFEQPSSYNDVSNILSVHSSHFNEIINTIECDSYAISHPNKKVYSQFENESMNSLSPDKQKIDNKSYNGFIEKHTKSLKSTPESKCKEIRVDSPIFGQVEDKLMDYDLADPLEDSKGSISCDSENPIPTIPIPISPDMNNFPKFKQEAFIEDFSIKPRVTQSKSVIREAAKAPMKSHISSENIQEQSIDTFIQHKGNQFLETLKTPLELNILRDSKDSVNIPNSRNLKFTPQKKYSCQTTSFTPLGTSFARKYMIQRESDNQDQTPSKSEEKNFISTLSSKNTKEVPKRVDNTTPFSQNAKASLSIDEHVAQRRRESRKTESEKRSKDDINGFLTHKIAPLINKIKNTVSSTKSMDRLSTEKLHKYSTPRISTNNLAQFNDPTMKDVGVCLKSKFEHNTEIKKIQKKQ